MLDDLRSADSEFHKSLEYILANDPEPLMLTFTTDEELELAIAQIIETVIKLREMSPLYEMVKEGIDLKSIEWTAH